MFDRVVLVVAIVALTVLGIFALHHDDRASFSLVVVAVASLLPGASQIRKD